MVSAAAAGADEPRTEPHRWSRQRKPVQPDHARNHIDDLTSGSVRRRIRTNHLHGCSLAQRGGQGSATAAPWDKKTSSITKPHPSALAANPARSSPRRIHVRLAPAQTWNRPRKYRARTSIKAQPPGLERLVKSDLRLSSPHVTNGERQRRLVPTHPRGTCTSAS